jgi:hypothetical protein
MPASNANLMDGATEESTLLGVELALAQMPGGPTLADKGAGVQHVRDGSGKLTDVVVFFDDKVPQSDKAAALTKIAANTGVATVGPFGFTLNENFDALAPSSIISTDQSVSSPHSLKQGTSLSLFRFQNHLYPEWNSYQPITSFHLESKVYLASDLLLLSGTATGAHNLRVEFQLGELLLRWIAPVVGAAPPATLAPEADVLGFNVPGDGKMNEALTLPLPLDDAWHTISVEFVPGQAAVTYDFSIDGSTQRFTAPSTLAAISSPTTVFWRAIDFLTGGAGALETFIYIDDVSMSFDYA